MPGYRRLTDESLLADSRVEAFRGPGPGGQKRNKTSSAIRLTHAPTGIGSQAFEARSQNINRQVALRRLRHRLALLVREEIPPGKTSAPELLEVSRKSADYPAAMGHVLDVMTGQAWSVSETARALGTSTARLVKFLKNDPMLWTEVNRQRQLAGLRMLNS
jgi:hypothetical protein